VHSKFSFAQARGSEPLSFSAEPLIPDADARSAQPSTETAAGQERVAILLSTFNGAPFLARQLDSLLAQTHQNWVLYASDDGSKDATLNVLTTYQRKLKPGQLTILYGPSQGFAANFMSLIKNPDINANYFAFCDQDDVWTHDKIENALNWIRLIPADRSALYCSRTQLIDEQDNIIGISPLFAKVPCFENSLVQSIAGGNTMLFNAATRELLRKVEDRPDIVTHDWLTYILVSGNGGAVYYNPQPIIGYRQHGQNLVGSNSSFNDRLVRVKKMFGGTFRRWNEANLSVIAPLRQYLTPENQHTLELFQAARHAPFARRLQLLRRSGVHRQTLLGNIGLLAAAVLNKI